MKHTFGDTIFLNKPKSAEKYIKTLKTNNVVGVSIIIGLLSYYATHYFENMKISYIGIAILLLICVFYGILIIRKIRRQNELDWGLILMIVLFAIPIKFIVDDLSLIQ